MADQSLVAYIKQNLRDGFPQNEIQIALVGAGWSRHDIDEAFAEAGHGGQPQARPAPGAPAELSADLSYHPDVPASFLSRHGRLLVMIFILIILLPVLAYGGFWAYQRYSAPEETADPAPSPAPAPPPAPIIDEQAAVRDEQRIADVAGLQTALETYLAAKKAYPKTLDELVTEKIITAVPVDPKTQAPYLYSPFGGTPLDYSLSFILETGVGSMKKGLHEASPAQPLSASLIQKQNNAVKGLTAPAGTLRITDLARAPFYPGEEVKIDISSSAKLIQTVLTVNHLKLTDEHFPFSVRFSAPSRPGEYPVSVFGFAENGEVVSQSTKLTVKIEEGGGR